MMMGALLTQGITYARSKDLVSQYALLGRQPTGGFYGSANATHLKSGS
jgi:hypothetical protein